MNATHAGLCVVRYDGEPYVLLIQRSPDPTDAPDVAESWEFPGGSLDPGEDPFAGAKREFGEELGFCLPDGEITGGWVSPNGIYQGFVFEPVGFPAMMDWVPTAEAQAVAWVTPDGAQQMRLRPEMADFDWSLVSGNSANAGGMMIETPLDYSALTPAPLMMHGVLAPEAAPSGDLRGFTEGSVTTRPLRLPFGWQEWTASGHDQAITVGSIDRMMRKDGLIHFEGTLMTSAKACEFVELLSFFGQYGISVDGVNGNIDAAKSKADGMVWFDAVKVAGAVACSVPAFAEAYVALGPHPDMPAEDSEESGALTASMDLIGQRSEFGRGLGAATDPVAAERLHRYWTEKGQPGYDKVAWGTPGDFARAKALIGEELAKHSPKTLPFLNQIVAQWHYDALGYWPATHAKMDREASGTEKGGDGVKAEVQPWQPVLAASGTNDDLYFRDIPTAERKRLAQTGAALPDGSFPIANCSDLENAIRAIGRAKDPAAAKAHIRKRKADLNCTDVALPDSFSVEEPYELVLTAAAAGTKTRTRVLPPKTYFTRHPNTGATTIEEPDAQGFRRTHGYAAEWGVCHIGKAGRCVEPPLDPTGSYAHFHLGRTKTDKGYVKTGLITYGVAHRSTEEILSETPTQAHFDDLSCAWAAVVLGEDERGIWFSGVVLPTVEEKWLTAIEASGQVSGEWKNDALRTLLTVNVPGFPVLRSSAAFDDEGNVLALVASAFDNTLTASVNGVEDSPCAPTPAERMAALREIDREIQAEARFAALRAEFLAERAGV